MACPLCESVQLLQDFVDAITVGNPPDLEKLKLFTKKVEVMNVFGKNYVIPKFTFDDLSDCPLHGQGTWEDFAKSIGFLNHPEVVDLIFTVGQQYPDPSLSRPT